MTRALVVGAGLSGLATAWYLIEAGVPVHIVDARGQPGGLIRTHRTPEGLVETGANAFLRNERVDRLFRTLKVTPVCPQPSSRRRYIFRNGRPRRWPLTVRGTAVAASRLAASWLTRQLSTQADETVAEWGRRVVGAGATTWLIAPALQGIYAAPADVLSARAVFGHRRGPMRLIAPAGGMGQLIERLMETLDRRGATCEWNRPVTVLDPGRLTVLAVPAPAAASLLSKHAPRLAEAIAQVRMTSLLTVTAFFEPHPHDLRGFGVLFPRSEGVNALGVLFNNEVFPGRSTLRSETWIYGSAFSGPLPADVEILDAVVRDRATLTGQRAAPTASYPTRWPDALPVYDFAVLDVARQRAELPPWLGVSGNYFGRLGATHLLELAEETAARLTRHCRT